MGVDQPRAAGLEVDIGVADVSFAFAESLNFGTMEDQASLDLVEQMVIVGRGPILGDDCFLLRVLPLRGLLHGLFLSNGYGFGHAINPV
jgi:hypothetical protein